MPDKGMVPHMAGADAVFKGSTSGEAISSKDSVLVPPKAQVGKIHVETGRGYGGGSVNEIGNIEKIKG